jgi:hypothetical protein
MGLIALQYEYLLVILHSNELDLEHDDRC